MQTVQAIANIPARVPSAKPVEIFGIPGVSGFSMRFERNEEVFGEQEEADFLYKIVSGAVRTFRVLSDGRRQVVGFHLAGEVFGIERGERHRCSAEAITDCQILLIRSSAVEKAARASAEAAYWLWDLKSVELERLQDQMMLLGRKTAAERVAAFLLEMAGRGASDTVVDLPMSRCDIADYLGLTVETVSRTLTQFQRDGVIAMPSHRHILLRNRDALAREEA